MNKQVILNQALKQFSSIDPIAFQRLKSIKKSWILLHIVGLIDKKFYFHLNDAQISMQSSLDSGASLALTIKGSLRELCRLSYPDDWSTPSKSQSLELHGDMSLAIDLKKWIQSVDINFEALLCPYLTDIPSHLFCSFLKLLRHGLEEGAKRVNDNLSYYCQSEASIAPVFDEFEYFADNLTQLRNDIERYKLIDLDKKGSCI
jgi:ubiquinone biosynthesis protein UbiJ